jgi:hypothetical protein
VPRHPMLKGEEAKEAKKFHHGLLRKRKWEDIDIAQQNII